MSTITDLGIGTNGINTANIVSALVAVELAPLTALSAQAALDSAQISAFGTMQAEFSSLATTANAMATPDAWQSKTASSSNSSVATIAVTTAAQPGTFTLNVNQLALTQKLTSTGIPTGSTVGSGTLTFQAGTWTGSGSTATFAATTGSAPVSITVSATDTVASLAASINASNAGVTATVFNDGTSDHLLLASSATGAAAGFTVTATDGSGNPSTNGLANYALTADATTHVINPTGMAASGTPIQFAQNAQVTVNGLAVTSATNTLSNNIPGVTINLLAASTTNYGAANQVNAPVTLTVSQDLTGEVSNIQAFVSAYNTLVTDISAQTAYDPSTNTASLFQGDGTIVGLQSILSSMVGSISNGSSVYKRLSDVGIQVQTDGTLSINTAALSAAANNGTELQKLFITNNNDPATDGFALKFGNFAAGALAAGGLVANKAAALQTTLTQNKTDQATINTNAAALRTRLDAQYTALDTQMASLNALNSYVTQQIATWNKNTS